MKTQRAVPGLQILNSVKHYGKKQQQTNGIKPMTHYTQLEEPKTPVKMEEDTEKIAQQTGRILPLGICMNCD